MWGDPWSSRRGGGHAVRVCVCVCVCVFSENRIIWVYLRCTFKAFITLLHLSTDTTCLPHWPIYVSSPPPPPLLLPPTLLLSSSPPRLLASSPPLLPSSPPLHPPSLCRYVFGKTKVFIRKPVTLFNLEERRERCLNDVVSIIQGAYRSWAARKYVLK